MLPNVLAVISAIIFMVGVALDVLDLVMRSVVKYKSMRQAYSAS